MTFDLKDIPVEATDYWEMVEKTHIAVIMLHNEKKELSIVELASFIAKWHRAGVITFDQALIAMGAVVLQTQDLKHTRGGSLTLERGS